MQLAGFELPNGGEELDCFLDDVEIKLNSRNNSTDPYYSCVAKLCG